MKKLTLLVLVLSQSILAQTKINEGMWRGNLKLDVKNHVDLPFMFNVFYADGQPTFTIFNAEENIVVETYHTDSLQIIREKKGFVHLDGEPHEEGTEINYNVKPLALEIIGG